MKYLLATSLLLVIVATGCEGQPPRQIHCADNQSNDSGNICKTTIGTKECIAILPDGKSEYTNEDVPQLIQCAEKDGAE